MAELARKAPNCWVTLFTVDVVAPPAYFSATDHFLSLYCILSFILQRENKLPSLRTNNTLPLSHLSSCLSKTSVLPLLRVNLSVFTFLYNMQNNTHIEQCVKHVQLTVCEYKWRDHPGPHTMENKTSAYPCQ